MSLLSVAIKSVKNVLGSKVVSGAIRLATGLTIGGTASVVDVSSFGVEGYLVKISAFLLSAKEIVKAVSDFLAKVQPTIADLADNGKLDGSVK